MPREVWSIIGSLAPDGENAAQVAQDYDISPEALAAARAFYARHKKALDNRLAANRAAVGPRLKSRLRAAATMS